MTWRGVDSGSLPPEWVNPSDKAQVNVGEAVVYSFYEGDELVDIVVAQNISAEDGGYDTTTVLNSFYGPGGGTLYENHVIGRPIGTAGTLSINVVGGSSPTLIPGRRNHTIQRNTTLITATTREIGTYPAQGSVYPPGYDYVGGGVWRNAVSDLYYAVAGFVSYDKIVESTQGPEINEDHMVVVIPHRDASSVQLHVSLSTTVPTMTGSHWVMNGPDGTGEVYGLMLVPYAGGEKQGPFYGPWGGQIPNYAYTAYTYYPPVDGTTTSNSAYLVGGSVTASVSLMETVEAAPTMYTDLMYPWRLSAKPFPSFHVMQSTQRAWTAYYGDMGMGAPGGGYKDHDFPIECNAAIGWA
jgi:hypothetical protein